MVRACANLHDKLVLHIHLQPQLDRRAVHRVQHVAHATASVERSRASERQRSPVRLKPRLRAQANSTHRWNAAGEMSTNLEDLDLVLNVEATLHLRRNRARIRHPTATVL